MGILIFGRVVGPVLGCILAPFWHQFGSLGRPGDPKWASRGPGRESRGCFGGMLMLGVFLDDFREPHEVRAQGKLVVFRWYPGPLNTSYKTADYRLVTTDW